ncbi:hypothetical protein DSO57_1014650 [Entomophthora muscae]|uniref:Uncharacterized protein n=1 Tax=Entomophthora muscae TaxID=34485 RepID=A0ACC2S7C8_9FUNG|nr:hypothetical protein DSO57_1014650 [Entomophthora muscae]
MKVAFLIALFVTLVGAVPVFSADASDGNFFCRQGGPCLRRIGDGGRFNRGTGRDSGRGDGSDIELLDDGTIVFRDPSSSFNRGGRRWERKINIEVGDDSDSRSDADKEIKEDMDDFNDREDERVSSIAIDGGKRDEHTVNIGAKDVINGTSGFDHTTSLGNKKDEQKPTADIQSEKVDSRIAKIEVKEDVRKSIPGLDIDMSHGDRNGGVGTDEGKRTGPISNIGIKEEINKSGTNFSDRKGERDSIAEIKGGKGDGRTTDIDVKQDGGTGADINRGKIDITESKNTIGRGSKGERVTKTKNDIVAGSKSPALGSEGSNKRVDSIPFIELKDDAGKVVPGSNIDMNLDDISTDISADGVKRDVPTGIKDDARKGISNEAKDGERASAIGSGIDMNLGDRRDYPGSKISMGDGRKELKRIESKDGVATSDLGSNDTMKHDGKIGSHGSNVKLGKVERLTVLDHNSDVKAVDRPIFVEDNDSARRGSKTAIDGNNRKSPSESNIIMNDARREDTDIKHEGEESIISPSTDMNHDGKRGDHGTKTKLGDKKVEPGLVIDHNSNVTAGNRAASVGAKDEGAKSTIGSNTEINHDDKRGDRGSNTKLGDKKVERGPVLDRNSDPKAGSRDFIEVKDDERRSDIDSDTNMFRGEKDADRGSKVKLSDGKAERDVALDHNRDFKAGDRPSSIETKDGERRDTLDFKADNLAGNKGADRGSKTKPSDGKNGHVVTLDRNRDFKAGDGSSSVGVKDDERKAKVNILGGDKGTDHGSNIKVNDGKAERIAAIDRSSNVKAENHSSPAEVKDEERRGAIESKVDLIRDGKKADRGTKLDITEIKDVHSASFEAKDGARREDPRSTIKSGDGRVERSANSDISGSNQREGRSINSEDDERKGAIGSIVDTKLDSKKGNFRSNNALSNDKREDISAFIPLKDDARKDAPGPSTVINRGSRRVERGPGIDIEDIKGERGTKVNTASDGRREARKPNIEDSSVEDGSAFDRNTNIDVNREARKKAVSGLNMDDDRVVERNFIQIGRNRPNRDPSRAKLTHGIGRVELNRGFNRDLDRGFGLSRF